MNLEPLLNRLSIVDTRAHLIPFKLNWAQREYLAEVERQYNERRLIRVIVLKARQLGCSTLTEAIMFLWCFIYPRVQGLVMAHEASSAQHLLGMTRTYWDTYPFNSLYSTQYKSRNELSWIETASSLKVATAKTVDTGRSKTLQMLHLCLAPDTPILLPDGWSKPISQIVPGDKVLTHQGNEATVQVVSSYPAPSHCVTLETWLGGSVTLTKGHKVWTRSGWKAANDICVGEEVSMPIRPITDELTSISLPKWVNVRPQNQGSVPIQGDIPLDEETGYFFGYYLAEGSLGRQASGTPSSVSMARHRDEWSFGERAWEAIAPWCTSWNTKDKSYCLTSVETFYGTTLAQLIDRELGTKADKRVPDWAFRAGKDFLKGLLVGYLNGDGSKTTELANGKYMAARVCVTTVSCSLATQMRDIAASLGLGWGGITQREAGNYYGRNCKHTYTLSWNGQAARNIRALLGDETTWSSRLWIEKSQLSEDMAWIKVKSKHYSSPETVWDIAVDHPDHSFRTMYFSVSNSECAFYEHAEQTMGGLEQAFHFEPDTFGCLESTANGIGGFFYDQWNAAVDGDIEYVPLFFPWFRHPQYTYTYLMRADQSSLAPLGHCDDEERILQKIGVDADHLLWRRWALRNLCQNNESILHSEYPSTPEEAFVATGQNVYPLQHLRICYEPIEHPIIGRLLREGSRVKFVPDIAGPLKIYAYPSADTDYGKYMVAGDPARSAKDSSDYACAQVINRRSYEQVATWRGKIDGATFGEELAKLGMYYNQALLTVETTGGGYITIGSLVQMNYPNLYKHRYADREPTVVATQYGWDTNESRKQWMIGFLLKLIVDHVVIIHDAQTYFELRNYVTLPNGGFGPNSSSGYDDTVTSLAQACVCSSTEILMAYEGPSHGAQEESADTFQAWNEEPA